MGRTFYRIPVPKLSPRHLALAGGTLSVLLVAGLMYFNGHGKKTPVAPAPTPAPLMDTDSPLTTSPLRGEAPGLVPMPRLTDAEPARLGMGLPKSTGRLTMELFKPSDLAPPPL